MTDYNERILITGANGFIGSRVVETLLSHGFTNLRCFVRPSSDLTALNKIITLFDKARIKIVQGNLLSQDDCKRATDGISVIYHLAAGRGEKSYPDAFMNSVVTTRNLLDAALQNSVLKRFVNISSFTVYSNSKNQRGSLLDETSEIEDHPELRGEAYCYAKVRQEQLVMEYGKKYNMPYVILRPGAVYGPGNIGITQRVGIGTFGLFLHLGGSNIIPLSYVDNCAEAIVLAGIIKGVDNEVFNVVDDDQPTSRQFLKMYKKNVRHFKSIYLPKTISYLLCYLWEKYSKWSEGQLPPVFNRKKWASNWKGNRYSNKKLKRLLGWKQKVVFSDALEQYFKYQKEAGNK
ncbi:MAG: NAD(P)-dependent oxidoreductase [Nitrospirae bacterium]|nr:NAD(P)-dependent oxidoreductase [Nitrospirota bacterium]